MKPRTRRERMLIAEALELLNEAANLTSLNLTVSRVPTFSESFASPNSIDEKGNLTGAKANAKGTKTTVSNADKGTGSELVSLWYCASELKKKGSQFGGVLELGTVGTVTKDKNGNKIKKTAIALDLARTISRISGLRAKYTKDKFKSDIWDQGVQQGKQILEVLDAYLKAKKKKRTDLKKLKLVGLGESAAATKSTLIAQEDCQLQMEFKNDASLDGTLAFSNKAGGSDPGMLNKTPLSAGLLTKKQLEDGMNDNVAKIREDTINLYKELNKEVDIPAAVKKEYKKKKKNLPSNEEFWIGELCNQLKKGKKSGEGESIIDDCFKVGDRENFPDIPSDREDGYGVICPAKSKEAKKSKNVSLSSCCTTVMGTLAKSILEKSLAEAITDMGQLFDLIMLGDVKKGKSIFQTMYPSFYPSIKSLKKRNEIAKKALELMKTTDGKYFCVNGKPGTDKKAMSTTHKIFRGMLLDVSRNSKKKWSYTIPTGDVNGITFNYDKQPILTISVRKDKSDKMKFSKASVIVVQKLKANKPVSPAELKDAAKEIEAQGDPIVSMMDNVSPPASSPDMEVELEPVKMDGETQDVDPRSDGIETTADASPVEIEYPEGKASESIEAAMQKFPQMNFNDVSRSVIDDVAEVLKSMMTVKQVRTTPFSGTFLARNKGQEQLAQITQFLNQCKPGQANEFVGMFFNAKGEKLETKITISVGTEQELIELHAQLEAALPEQPTGDEGMTERVMTAIAKVLIEGDLLLEEPLDLTKFTPEQIISAIDASGIEIEIEEPIDGESVGDEADETIAESRWLKLAGLIKG